MSIFAPKPYKKLAITVRLFEEKLERVDSLANQRGLSRNDFINRCIDFAIENMEPDES